MKPIVLFVGIVLLNINAFAQHVIYPVHIQHQLDRFHAKTTYQLFNGKKKIDNANKNTGSTKPVSFAYFISSSNGSNWDDTTSRFKFIWNGSGNLVSYDEVYKMGYGTYRYSNFMNPVTEVSIDAQFGSLVLGASQEEHGYVGQPQLGTEFGTNDSIMFLDFIRYYPNGKYKGMSTYSRTGSIYAIDYTDTTVYNSDGYMTYYLAKSDFGSGLVESYLEENTYNSNKLITSQLIKNYNATTKTLDTLSYTTYSYTMSGTDIISVDILYNYSSSSILTRYTLKYSSNRLSNLGKYMYSTMTNSWLGLDSLENIQYQSYNYTNFVNQFDGGFFMDDLYSVISTPDPQNIKNSPILCKGYTSWTPSPVLPMKKLKFDARYNSDNLVTWYRKSGFDFGNNDFDTVNATVSIFSYDAQKNMTRYAELNQTDTNDAKRFDIGYGSGNEVMEHNTFYWLSNSTYEKQDRAILYYTSNNAGIAGMNNISLNIYPNPANQYITIQNSVLVNEPLYIYNSEGKLIYNGIMNRTQTIDIGGWPAGIYLLKTQSGTARILKTQN